MSAPTEETLECRPDVEPRANTSAAPTDAGKSGGAWEPAISFLNALMRALFPWPV
jgi:hypothetical protein